MRLARGQPRPVLGVAAIDAAPTPTESCAPGLQRHPVEQRPLHPVLAILGQKKAKLAVRPGPTFGSVGRRHRGFVRPKLGRVLLSHDLRQREVRVLLSMTLRLTAVRDGRELERSPVTANPPIGQRDRQHESAASVVEVQGNRSSVRKSDLLLNPRLIAGDAEIVHDLQL